MIAWYELLLGRAPDVVVREGNEAMWQVVNAGWVYVVRDEARAGKALLALLVPDLQKFTGELAKRGIRCPDVETEPGLYRKVVISDPEGNTITIGENLNSE